MKDNIVNPLKKVHGQEVEEEVDEETGMFGKAKEIESDEEQDPDMPVEYRTFRRRKTELLREAIQESASDLISVNLTTGQLESEESPLKS